MHVLAGLRISLQSAFLKSKRSQARVHSLHCMDVQVFILMHRESTRVSLIDNRGAGAWPCLWSRQAVGGGGC